MMRKWFFILGFFLVLFTAPPWSSGPAASEEDPVTAWRRWKDISSAILIRPQDGPEDILEKSEIIEDRLDRLAQERSRLITERDAAMKRAASYENQRETLKDLEGMWRGRDHQTRQRTHVLTERIQQEQNLLGRLNESIRGIEEELGSGRELLNQYRDKAQQLRMEERGGK